MQKWFHRCRLYLLALCVISVNHFAAFSWRHLPCESSQRSATLAQRISYRRQSTELERKCSKAGPLRARSPDKETQTESGGSHDEEILGRVVIAGLGPGNPSFLTRAVWDEICSSSEVYARIGRHPTLSAIPETTKITTFEKYYEEAETFEFLYSNISDRILELAKEHGKILYLVPGDPWVGETTTKLITNRSSSQGVQVDILPGISFVEPTLAALKVDLLPRLLVGDSYELVNFQHLPLECNTPLLISQLEDQFEASALKVVLMTSFSPDHTVALVHAAGSADCKVEWLPLQSMDQSPAIGIMTSLYVPAATGAFSQLRDAVARHREATDFWDDMTHAGLSARLLQACKTLATVAKDDPPEAAELSESLARVLAFAVAHLQLGEDDNDLTARDVMLRASEIAKEIGDEHEK